MLHIHIKAVLDEVFCADKLHNAVVDLYLSSMMFLYKVFTEFDYFFVFWLGELVLEFLYNEIYVSDELVSYYLLPLWATIAQYILLL